MADVTATANESRCPVCGAIATGRFCSECGAALGVQPAGPGRALREEAVETIGFDRRLLVTLRDLLVRPIRVVRAAMAGDRRRYLPPLRLFLAFGGLYMLGLSLVQPFQFDPPSLRRMGVREQDAARIAQHLEKKAIGVELFNERFETRMNTVAPIVTAFALLPLVPLLRAFDRRRSWAEHLMFILSASNGVWLYGLLLLPLAFASMQLYQLVIAFGLYTYLGIVFFDVYPAATRMRTLGRFAVFAVVDFVLSVVISTVVFVLVYGSVLLF
jgi:hypothetical protein